MESDTLKKELIGLFQYIQRVKEEISAINRPAEDEHNFESMADQLGAIIKATEHATNTIMESVERSDEVISDLRRHVKDNAAAGALLDKLSEGGQVIFEACSFQDITGQRVNKIMKSLSYVEQRVDAIVSIWGEHELAKVAVKPTAEKSEDEKLLNGPQLEGNGLSQADIDALFN